MEWLRKRIVSGMVVFWSMFRYMNIIGVMEIIALIVNSVHLDLKRKVV